MKRFTSYLPMLLLFVVAALLSKCERYMDEWNDTPYDSSQPISFTAETDMATRGTPINNAEDLTSMGVFCAATGLDDWSSTATANKMFNERLNNNSGTWTYHNSDIYWGATDITERYSFFAYTPYASIDNGITVTGSSSTQGKPTLTYTVPNDVTKQPDLMFAVPRYNIRPRGNKVALAMKHALTCVGFQIMGDGEQLTAISISGISVSGDIIMDGSNIEWTNLGAPTSTDFSASINYDMGEDYFTLSTTMTNLLASDGYLMMIPQQLGSDAKIKLTFKDNTVKEISLDNFIWEAGKRVSYAITVIPDGTITVTPDNVLLPYTAQNPASQNVNLLCLKGDGTPDHTAQWTLTSSQSWLTLSLNSNGSAASATVSGTGSQAVYLVAGINSSTTTPRMAALFLNGETGNVVANITQGVNLNNIPGGGILLGSSYVGAFWRAGETGERLIRVTYVVNGPWTATVAWMDERWNAGDIVLDATPFFQADENARGITWDALTENPDDAENWSVTSNATSVSGTGRIFFRIGLKQKFSDLPSCDLENPDYVSTFPARYAVVLITHSNGVQKLFLRQGEGADYLMREGDPDITGSTVAENRARTVRFSPYNLTYSKNLWTTSGDGTSVTDHPQLALNGGEFVRYPTQAGAYFQWSVSAASQAIYARRAYHPIYPTIQLDGAIPWERTASYLGYWTSSVNNHATVSETCPPGYRRPNDGATSVDQIATTIIGSEMRQSLYWKLFDGENVQSTENSVFGYYADGFFDRRAIVRGPSSSSPTGATSVSVTNSNFATNGRLFFNPLTNTSLFFPAAGSRSGQFGGLSTPGGNGIYWTSTSGATNRSCYMIFSNNSTTQSSYSRYQAHSVRCVRE